MSELECLTVNELAGELKVHPQTVRAWVKLGKIPVIKMPGGSVRFEKARIKSWMNIRTINAKKIGQ